MLSRVFLLLALSGVVACSSAQEMEEAIVPQAEAQSSSASASASGTGSSSASSSVSSDGGAAFAIATDAYEFEYGWPAEVAAIPALSTKIDAMRRAEEKKFGAMAAEAKTDAAQNDYPFRPYGTSTDWKVAADLPGYLSLTLDHWVYTGGAHGNYWRQSKVWDRGAENLLDPKALFVSVAALNSAVSDRYCAALDAEREKRRGQPVKKDGTFGACPPMDEITVIAGSSNGRTFDRLGFYAAPYVAGSYAEGAYEVTLPVDDAVISAVKPAYRGAFSVPR